MTKYLQSINNFSRIYELIVVINPTETLIINNNRNVVRTIK